jgi:hypothetical protein
VGLPVDGLACPVAQANAANARIETTADKRDHDFVRIVVSSQSDRDPSVRHGWVIRPVRLWAGHRCILGPSPGQAGVAKVTDPGPFGTAPTRSGVADRWLDGYRDGARVGWSKVKDRRWCEREAWRFDRR